MDLIADFGASRTRCALVDDRGRILATEFFRNGDFTGVDGLLQIYLDHRRESDRPSESSLNTPNTTVTTTAYRTSVVHASRVNRATRSRPRCRSLIRPPAGSRLRVPS